MPSPDKLPEGVWIRNYPNNFNRPFRVVSQGMNARGEPCYQVQYVTPHIRTIFNLVKERWSDFRPATQQEINDELLR